MTIDVLLYVDRLDVYRVDDLDKQVVTAITDAFGKEIWKKSALVLSHAQFSPPDGLNYDLFVSRRSDALLKLIRASAQLKKQDMQVPPFITNLGNILRLRLTSKCFFLRIHLFLSFLLRTADDVIRMRAMKR